MKPMKQSAPGAKGLSSLGRMAVFASLSLIAALVLPLGDVTAAPKKTFVYVHDSGVGNQVFGFNLLDTGNLVPVAGSPFASNAGASGLPNGDRQTAAFSATRKLLFVTGSAGITVFKVAVDGTLSRVIGSPFGGAANFQGVAVVDRSPFTFVYATDFDNDEIRGFKVQQNSTLTELATSPVSTVGEPVGLSSVKDVVYVAGSLDGRIAAYRVKFSGLLVLTPNSPVDTTSSFIFNVNVDAEGRFVYAADGEGAQVFGFRTKLGDGSISSLTDSPFASLTDTGSGLAVGKNVLFALSFSNLTGSNDVQAFRRKVNGKLEQLGSGPASSGLNGVRCGAFDTTHNFLLLASDGSASIRSYTVNTGSGALTFQDSETAGATNSALLTIRR